MLFYGDLSSNSLVDLIGCNRYLLHDYSVVGFVDSFKFRDIAPLY